MRIWFQPLLLLGALGWSLAVAWAAPQLQSESNAAIQAIQQAPDPSAVVAAYANGMATDRNNPRLLDAYVSRMVDLGLPELAFHQAQSLTGLQSNNGLAWGVIAYVNARRGEMPDAISAINLAGQFAPDNKFVVRTAGEIIAWYDQKADKSTLPENAKDGLAKVRSLVEKDPAFTTAYDTAKKAYQAQTTSSPSQQQQQQLTPSQVAPQSQSSPADQADQVAPLGYSVSPAPVYSPGYAPSYYGAASYYPYYPSYYSDYYYDWGPGWVQPAPWWWWRPVGFFTGFAFTPFSTVVVFDHHGSFNHHGFYHHGGPFVPHNWNQFAFQHHNPAFWHQGPHGNFFGTPARPNNAFAQWARLNSGTVPTLANRPTATVPGINSALPLTVQPQRGIHGRLNTPQTFAPGNVLASTGRSAGRIDPGTAAIAPRNVAPLAGPVTRSPTPSVAAQLPRGSQSFSTPAMPRTLNTLPSRSGSRAIYSTPSWPSLNSQNRVLAPPPVQRSWAGSPPMAGSAFRTAPVPRSSFATPSFRAPSTLAPSMAAPRFAAPPSGGFGGGFRGGPAMGAGGSFHGAPAMGGGGFRGGGGFSGGGGHGGGRGR